MNKQEVLEKELYEWFQSHEEKKSVELRAIFIKSGDLDCECNIEFACIIHRIEGFLKARIGRYD